jgi:transcription termination/antitermination protein NusG
LTILIKETSEISPPWGGELCESELIHMHNITPRNWYAIYTKPRHEFVVHGELQKKGIESFLPTFKRLQQWKDRKKFVEFPLFPGYLFVCIQHNNASFLNVLKTRGVVTFISSTPGNPSSVPVEEIQSLKILLESGEEIDVYPHLKEGELIRVKSGPLKGAEGVLVMKENQYQFLVNIHLLGRSVGLKIYADQLEAA